MKITDELLEELGFDKVSTMYGDYFYEYSISNKDEWNPIYLTTIELSDEAQEGWSVMMNDLPSIRWTDGKKLSQFVKNIKEACENTL